VERRGAGGMSEEGETGAPAALLITGLGGVAPICVYHWEPWPSYWPWASATGFGKLQAQRSAARPVSGPWLL